MSRFRIGQRVKKVRGTRCIGNTGIVSVAPVTYFKRSAGFDFTVICEHPSLDLNGDRWPAGTVFDCRSHEWEPILDTKHEACDDEFKRDLDRMLDRQGVAA